MAYVISGRIFFWLAVVDNNIIYSFYQDFKVWEGEIGVDFNKVLFLLSFVRIQIPPKMSES